MKEEIKEEINSIFWEMEGCLLELLVWEEELKKIRRRVKELIAQYSFLEDQLKKLRDMREWN